MSFFSKKTSKAARKAAGAIKSLFASKVPAPTATDTAAVNSNPVKTATTAPIPHTTPTAPTTLRPDADATDTTRPEVRESIIFDLAEFQPLGRATSGISSFSVISTVSAVSSQPSSRSASSSSSSTSAIAPRTASRTVKRPIEYDRLSIGSIASTGSFYSMDSGPAPIHSPYPTVQVGQTGTSSMRSPSSLGTSASDSSISVYSQDSSWEDWTTTPCVRIQDTDGNVISSVCSAPLSSSPCPTCGVPSSPMGSVAATDVLEPPAALEPSLDTDKVSIVDTYEHEGIVYNVYAVEDADGQGRIAIAPAP